MDWKAPADPGDEPVSGYEYAVDAGAWQKTSGAASRSTQAAQTGYQHTLTDLPPGQTYTVRVRAVNSYGGGPAAETTVELAPPPPPLPPEEEGDTGDTDDSGGGPGGTPGGDATQSDDSTSAEPTGYLENPGHNSFQSGIGLISGWVCEAESVEVELGHLGRQEAAYGTERADTEETAEGEELCGDTDNGFGLLFNWNLLGAGVHTVVAYVDGMELDRATVTVTTVGAGEEEEFLRDVVGECLVEDFPMDGQTTTLVWQQTSQNFVITDVE